MSGWNYRIFKRVHRHKYLHEPEILYEIRETFYDNNENISGVAETPEVIADNLEGLKWTLNKMLEGCDKPILDYDTTNEIQDPN